MMTPHPQSRSEDWHGIGTSFRAARAHLQRHVLHDETEVNELDSRKAAATEH